ncbi:hypothetical protein GCM10007907_17790 [Chitinimonas prasina]|uniref:Uncharacterized protein n=1 Tax=Chitinimonas prasina TaxID=1434937 RepID=A0ABQ5YJ63_9NEIS|nr:hemagglutinin repeat-containing protein [Chitinimonas prasina]GLR12989.1 hypothetical protein GCM10007907_17790 [Chitinimonas prasina]
MGIVNDGGSLTATGDVVVDAGDAALSNTGGRIETANSLRIKAAEVHSRQQGRIVAGAALDMQARKLLNQQSVLASGAKLELRGYELINNDGGVLSSKGDVALEAAMLSNQGGSLVTEGAMSLVTQNALNGRDGKVYAANRLNVEAAEVDMQGGVLAAGSGLALQAGGLVNLVGATVQAGQSVDVRAGSLDASRATASVEGDLTLKAAQVRTDAARITAGGLLDLAADGFSNAGGVLLAAKAGRLAVLGTLDNSGGKLMTEQGLVVTAQRLLSVGGTLASNGDVSLSAAEIDNQRGAMFSNGQIALAAARFDNRKGLVQGSGNVEMTVGHFDNGQGGVEAAQAIALRADRVENQQGRLVATGKLGITAQALDNQGGLAVAAGELVVDAASMNNRGGRLGAGTTLAVKTAGQLDNQGGEIASNGAMTLTATGLGNGAGVISAGGQLDAELAGGVLDGGSGKLLAGGPMNIKAGELRLAGGTVASNDVLSLDVAKLDADGGTLQADKALTLKMEALSAKGGAAIQTGGDLVADVQTMALSAGGKLLANGNADVKVADLALNGGQIVAAGKLKLATPNLTAGAGSMLGAGGQLEITTQALNNAGTLSAGGDMQLSASHTTNSGKMLAGGKLGLVTERFDNLGGAVAANQRVEIALSGDLRNSGRIESQQGLDVVARAIDNTGGTLNANGQIKLVTDDIVNRNGVLATGGNFVFNGTRFDNTGGSLVAEGSIDMAAQQFSTVGGLMSAGGRLAVKVDGTLDNRQGKLLAGSDLQLNGAGSINNTGGVLSAGNSIVFGSTLRDLVNTGGVVSTNGSLTLNLPSLNNRGGKIHAGALSIVAAGGDVDNSAGQLVSSGAMRISGDSLNNQGGTVSAGGSLEFTTRQIQNNGGTLVAQNTLDLGAATLSNSGGTVAALAGDLMINTQGRDFDNNGGTLQAGKLLTVNTGNFSNLGGRLIGGSLDFTSSGALSNSGIIHSGGVSTVKAGSINNNAGSITAVGQLTVNAQNGVLGNAGGTIASSGGVTVTAQSLQNNGGKVSSEQALTLNSGTINNSQGTLVAGKALAMNGLQSLTNTGGVVASLGDSLTLHTDGRDFDNAGGTLQAGTKLDLRTGAFNNAGGKLLAGSEVALTAGGAVNNDGGVISSGTDKAAGIVKVTGNGISNNGGQIQASGDITLDAGSKALSNNGSSAAIVSGGALSVTAGSVANQAGYMGAAGNLTLTANGGAIDNGGGKVVSNADLMVKGASLNNAGGQIGSKQITKLVVDNSVNNRGGSILASTVDIGATSLDNSAGGDIEGNHINIALKETEAGVFNNDGGKVISNNGIKLIAHGVSNAGGVFSAKGTLDVKASSLINTGGQLLADADLLLNASRFSADGLTKAQGGVTMTIGSDYTNTGVVSANGVVNYVIKGKLQNSGTVSAVSGLNITADGLSNTGEIYAPTTYVESTGNLSNSGLIDGGTVTVTASGGDIANTGRIYGDKLTVVASGNVSNSAGGVIAARAGGLSIGAGTLSNSGNGLIYSMGDLSIGANVENAGSTIQAAGNLGITGAVSNLNTDVVTRDKSTSVHKVEILRNGATESFGAERFVGLGGIKVQFIVDPATYGKRQRLAVAYTVERSRDCDPNCEHTFNYAYDSPIFEQYGLARPPAPPADPSANVCKGRGKNETCNTAGYFYTQEALPFYQALDAKISATNAAIDHDNRTEEFEDYVVRDYTETRREQEVVSATLGKILAGGNLAINGSVTNAGWLVADGTLAVAGGSVDNTAGQGYAEVVRSGTAQNTWVDCNADWKGKCRHRRIWDTAGVYNPGAERVTTVPSTVRYESNAGDAGGGGVESRKDAQSSGPVAGEGADGKGNDRKPNTSAGGGNTTGVGAPTGSASVTQPGGSGGTATRPGAGSGSSSRQDTQLSNQAPLDVDGPVVAGPDQVKVGQTGSISSQQADNRTRVNPIDVPVRAGVVGNVPTEQGVDPAAKADTPLQAGSAGATPVEAPVGNGSGTTVKVDSATNPNSTAAPAAGEPLRAAVDERPDAIAVRLTQEADDASTQGTMTALEAPKPQVSKPEGAGKAGSTGTQATSGAGTPAVKPQEAVTRVADPVKIPDNQLFKRHDNPDHPYLVETDPRFTQYKQFLGSDYYLGQLQLDPSRTLKRIGDGFYEQQLVAEQLLKLSGRGSLPGMNLEASFRDLMDAGVSYGQRLQLTPGVALTGAQMAQLTDDIVWLIEEEVNGQKVLVPRVYLRHGSDGQLRADGNLMAGNRVALDVTGTVNNSGRIGAHNDLVIRGTDIVNAGGRIQGNEVALIARQDLINLSGQISGGQSVYLDAGRDLKIETRTIDTVGLSGTRVNIDRLASVTGGDVVMQAGRDIRVLGGDVHAGGNLSLDAKGKIDLLALAGGSSNNVDLSRGNYLRDSQTTHQTTNMTAGQSLISMANGGIKLFGANLLAGGLLGLSGASLDISAAVDSSSFGVRTSDHKSYLGYGGSSEALAGGVLANKGDMNLIAKVGDLRIVGGKLSSDGQLSLTSAGNVHIGSVNLQQESYLDSFTQSRNLVSKKSTEIHDQSSLTLATGSLLSANRIAIMAGQDLGISGSQVVGSKDVSLFATGNINIEAARSSWTEKHFLEVKQSGFNTATQGIGFSYDKSTQRSDINAQGSVQSDVRSMVGSLGGNLLIEAGKQVSIVGSDLAANRASTDLTKATGHIDIKAENIVIKPGQDSDQTIAKLYTQQKGIGLALVGTPLDTFRNLKATADSDASGARKMHDVAGELFASQLTAPQLALTYKKSETSSTTETQSTTQVGSSLTAAGNIQLRASGSGKLDAAGKPVDGDISIAGSSLNAGELALLEAKRNVSLQSVADSGSSSSESQSSGKSISTAVASLGDIARLAHGGPNSSGVGASPYNSRESEEQGSSKGTQQTVTTITANQIAINSSEGDIRAAGVALSAKGDIDLSAKQGQITLAAVANTNQQEGHGSSKVVGDMGGNGTSLSIGVRKQDHSASLDQTNQSAVRNQVISQNGSINLTAKDEVKVQSTELIAGRDLSVTGSHIDIQPSVDTEQHRQQQTSSQYGVTAALSNSMVNAVNSVVQNAEKAEQTEDKRLAALYGAKAAMDGYNAVQNIQAGSQSASSFKVTISIGGGEQESQSSSATTQNLGSVLKAGENLNLTATGSGQKTADGFASDGDIVLAGADLSGKNVTLTAARDILATSAQNKTEQQGSQQGSNGSIGIGFGVGEQTGFTLELGASTNQAKQNGSSLSNQETQIVATNTLTLDSGRDTLIQGAQLKGDSVVADVGRDLRIESLQDSSKFDSKESSGGFSASICVPPFCFGSTVSGSVSASAGKINSNYQSVVEQSGLYAGKGGFDIDVGRHTELTGGVIASAADADKNRISTDTLAFRDLQNQAEYKAGSLGVTVSGSSGNLNQGAPVDSGVQDFADEWNKAPTDPRKDAGSQTGANPNIGLPSADSASGTTASAIGAGTIEVRSDQGTGQDSTAGLSRDTAAANGAIDQIFDEKAVRAQQELSRLTGEVGFKLVGDLASSQKADAEKRLAEAKASGNQDAINAAQADVNAWSDGGSYKVVMHGLTGFLQAKLGGGNVSASTLAALGNEAMLPYLADYLKSQGLKEGSSEFNSLLKLGSAVVGSAIGQVVGGGQAGASTAVAATTNNFLKHTDVLALKGELARCKAKSGGCSDDEVKAIANKYVAISSQNIANEQKCVAAGNVQCVINMIGQAADSTELSGVLPVGFGEVERVLITRQDNIQTYHTVRGQYSLYGSDVAQAQEIAKFRKENCIGMSSSACDQKVQKALDDRQIRAFLTMAATSTMPVVANGLRGVRIPGKPNAGTAVAGETTAGRGGVNGKTNTVSDVEFNPATNKYEIVSTTDVPAGSLSGKKVDATLTEQNPVTGVFKPVTPGTAVVVAKPTSPTVGGGVAASSAGQPATGTSLVTTTSGTSLVVVNGNGMLKPSTGAGQGGSAAAGDVLLLGLGPIDPSRVMVPTSASAVVPDNPTAYSVVYEMKLDPADFGKSRSVHFNRANAALDTALKNDAQFAFMMEGLIPGVQSSVSSIGGRATPINWTWEHASSSTANGQIGVMRLVPTEQHTPGSAFWRILHPNAGAAGGYSEWAIPAGAPKN